MALGHATNGEAPRGSRSTTTSRRPTTSETHRIQCGRNRDGRLGVRRGQRSRPTVLQSASGNQSYITNEDIVECSEQYEANGPVGVDEELRRIPFLETGSRQGDRCDAKTSTSP